MVIICPHCKKQVEKTIDYYRAKFWATVLKTDSCWLWSKDVNSRYGRFCYFSKIVYAHQFSWFLTHGYWSKKFILHSCDNSRCVNPDHLSEGTPKENTQDAIKKGRMPQLGKGAPLGYVHTHRKLTFAIAEKIRQEHMLRGKGFLAKKYKVSENTIAQIVTYCTYKN